MEPIPPNLGYIFYFSMVMTPRGVQSKTRDTYDRYVWCVLDLCLWLVLYQAYEWVLLLKMYVSKSDILVHEEDECLDHSNKIQWIPYDDRRWTVEVGVNLEWIILSYDVRNYLGYTQSTYGSLTPVIHWFPGINWIGSLLGT